ncbi:NAD(+) diphosphatase [Oerskovia turbata]
MTDQSVPPPSASHPSTSGPTRAFAANLPLAHSLLDRAAHRRTEEGLIATLRAQPSTRVVLLHRGRLAIGPHGLALATPEEVAAVPEPPAASGDHSTTPRWVFLGEDAPSGTSFLALLLPDDAGDLDFDIEGVDPKGPLSVLVRSHEWSGLRELGPRLGPLDTGLATEAVALAAWHAANERCPRCGEPTVPVAAGWVRRCVAQNVEHYPRTDPAVIMSVVDPGAGPGEDRILLGHPAHWPKGRFSTLAGYVEPGEGLEQAVRREVAEEVGITIGDVVYRGSQPWPFPASLMMAFTATALTTDVTPDGEEVTDALWFTRAELARAVESGDVWLPSQSSIARALIEEWFGGPLAGE